MTLSAKLSKFIMEFSIAYYEASTKKWVSKMGIIFPINSVPWSVTQLPVKVSMSWSPDKDWKWGFKMLLGLLPEEFISDITQCTC